jgi:4a-hydroxytetrahydrobiopterin dehydratase
LGRLSDWGLNGKGHLEKTYPFEGFKPGLEFVGRVGEMAEEQGHHPDIFLAWGKVTLEVWTHKINGLAESDFIFAAKADSLL